MKPIKHRIGPFKNGYSILFTRGAIYWVPPEGGMFKDMLRLRWRPLTRNERAWIASQRKDDEPLDLRDVGVDFFTLRELPATAYNGQRRFRIDDEHAAQLRTCLNPAYTEMRWVADTDTWRIVHL